MDGGVHDEEAGQQGKADAEKKEVVEERSMDWPALFFHGHGRVRHIPLLLSVLTPNIMFFLPGVTFLSSLSSHGASLDLSGRLLVVCRIILLTFLSDSERPCISSVSLSSCLRSNFELVCICHRRILSNICISITCLYLAF